MQFYNLGNLNEIFAKFNFNDHYVNCEEARSADEAICPLSDIYKTVGKNYGENN